MTLARTLASRGIGSSRLDDLVHEAAGRLASQANNDGLVEQLAFLEAAGYSEADILSALEERS
jgi:hypothetical protein